MLRRITSRLGVLVCALTAAAALADVAHAGLVDGATATVSTATQPAVETVSSAVQAPPPTVAQAVQAAAPTVAQAVQAPAPVAAPAVQAPAPVSAVAAPVAAALQTVSATASETTAAVAETARPVTQSVTAPVSDTEAAAPVTQVPELVEHATVKTSAALSEPASTPAQAGPQGSALAPESMPESNAAPTATATPATSRAVAALTHASAKKIHPPPTAALQPFAATPMATAGVAESKVGRATDAPAKRSPNAPRSPQLPIPGLLSALGDAGASAPILFGLFCLLFLLAIPTAVRWLRPALALGLSPVYVAAGDRPG